MLKNNNAPTFNSITAHYILTADIGGSHITVAVCDLSTASIIENSLTRVEVDSNGPAGPILSAWATAFTQALEKAELPVSGLGIAMPGPFDYENGISYIKGLNKYEELYGMNIKQYFAGLLNLPFREIRFRNDAEATIAGEALAGAAKHLNTVMGVTLGTGFGSAYCQEQITRDLNLGSDPFKNSIADDYLSTPWFIQTYKELTGISLPGVKDLAVVAEASLAARRVFEEFAINMSAFLVKPLNWFKPQALMLCGNIAKASDLFLTSLKLRLNGTTIIIAELGEQAALIGAAALFKRQTDVEVSSSQ